MKPRFHMGFQKCRPYLLPLPNPAEFHQHLKQPRWHTNVVVTTMAHPPKVAVEEQLRHHALPSPLVIHHQPRRLLFRHQQAVQRDHLVNRKIHELEAGLPLAVVQVTDQAPLLLQALLISCSLR